MSEPALPEALVVAAEPGQVEAVRAAVGGLVDVYRTAATGLDGVLAVGRHRPALAVVDVELPVLGGYEAARQMLDLSPGTAVILTAPRFGLEVVQAAMQIGVQDLVERPFAAESMASSVARWLARGRRDAARAEPAPVRPAQGIWAFAGPRGGEGRTTLLLALAWILVDRGEKVVVVDLDSTYGNITFYLGLPGGSAAPDPAAPAPAPTLEALHRSIVSHACGVPVLSIGADGAVPSIEALHQSLETLASAFSYVLVDLPVGVPEGLLSVLDRARKVVLVGAADPGNLRALRVLHRVMLVCGYTPSKLGAAITSCADRSAVVPFCEAAGIGLWGVVPAAAEQIDKAVRAGLPAPVLDRTSVYSRAVDALLERLLGHD